MARCLAGQRRNRVFSLDSIIRPPGSQQLPCAAEGPIHKLAKNNRIIKANGLFFLVFFLVDKRLVFGQLIDRQGYLMKKYLVEFIGVFLFVTTVGMVVLDPHSAGPLAPIAIGSVLMILVYAGGHVSGGHYNPAVTLAVWLRGRLPSALVIPYWISQILGAAIASQVVLYLKGNPALSPSDIPAVPSLIAEFIGTFALAYVVLNVATAKSTMGNSYFGLAIGFTVVVMAFSFGGISGGCFNPAIATGATLVHLEKFSSFWIYVVGDLAGGALAAFTFRFINPEDT